MSESLQVPDKMPDRKKTENILEEGAAEQKKKEIYDQKYHELTVVNQELAILQRKAENYTSAAEIAQYHQKFIELFEAINVLIEQKRSIFSQLTNF